MPLCSVEIALSLLPLLWLMPKLPPDTPPLPPLIPTLQPRLLLLLDAVFCWVVMSKSLTVKSPVRALILPPLRLSTSKSPWMSPVVKVEFCCSTAWEWRLALLPLTLAPILPVLDNEALCELERLLLLAVLWLVPEVSASLLIFSSSC